MGGFYGSVQVRTTDRDQVRTAAEAVAAERGCRCYLGPALQGWVGVYPSNNGQDISFGQAVSAKLPQPALHLLVHDDDILAYELWQAGESLDRYWSKPGYFGEEERAEQDAAAGQPELLAQLFGCAEADAAEVLLREPPLLFEVERLTRLEKLLGIRNAVTAYEYLQWGERDNIQGWKQFEELPASALVGERSAKQERRKQITAGRKRLEKAGLLLAEKKYKGFSVTGLPCRDNQFIVFWHHYADLGDVALWRAPWKKTDRSTVDLGEFPYAPVTSADGSRLAYTANEATIVVETATWKPIQRMAGNRHVVVLSIDGALLASLEHVVSDKGVSQSVVKVLRVSDGTTVATANRIEQARHAVFSPDGRHLVIAETDLWLLPLTGGHRAERKFLGGSIPTGPLAGILMHTGPAEYAQVIAKFEATLEQSTEQASGMLLLGSAKASPDEVEAMKNRLRAHMRQQLETMRAQYEALSSGTLPAAERQGLEHPFRVGFCRGGELLWCATDKGMRVYDWQAVLMADSNMPNPVMQFAPPGHDEHGLTQSYVYAAAEAADGALLFGGLTGVVYRLDLSTGETSEFLKPPEGGAVMHLGLTTNGRYLGMTTRPGFPSSRVSPDKQSQVWQVWDYEALKSR